MHQIVGAVLEAISEAEVGDDDVAVAVQEEIFELEVAVDDFTLMNVPNAGDELGEKTACILFFEEAMGENVIEQFAARGVVEDDADVFVGLDNIVQPHDIRVFEHLYLCPDRVKRLNARVEQNKGRPTLRTSISRSTFDMRTAESILCLFMSLTATSSAQAVWRPSLTFPNSPSPRVCRSKYGPNFGMARRGCVAAYCIADGCE